VFFRAENDYAEAYVLLLYWQDAGSSGFNKEADALEKLFETDFNYPRDHIIRFEIPLKQSQVALELAV
jgi:hypothetical protein